MRKAPLLFPALVAILSFGGCANPTTPAAAAKDTTAPAEVTALVATVGNAQATLSWTAPPDSDFASVEISASGIPTSAVPKGTTSKAITSLTNGIEYTFMVRTVDTSGNKSAGTTVKATPAASVVATTYTVAFESNGGGPVASMTGVASGATIAKPTDPTKVGYAFDNWYKESTFTTIWNFAADTVTSNATLYAKWNANSYTVSFDSQGGSSVGSVTANYDTTIAVPAAPTKAGYTFAGWWTGANGSGTEFTGSTIITGVVTVYANWTVNSYTVSFDNQGGGTVGSISADYSTTIILPAAPIKTGFTFAGWWTGTLGSGTQFTASTSVTGNITLYANWTLDTGTGGITINNPASVTIAFTTVPPTTLAVGTDLTIIASPSSRVDSFTWYVDGTVDAGNTAATFTGGAGLSNGVHNITVVVKKSGSLFSCGFTFMVQ